MAIGVSEIYVDDDGKAHCCIHRRFDSMKAYKEAGHLTAKEVERLARDAAKTPTPRQVQGTTATGGKVMRDKRGRVRVIPD